MNREWLIVAWLVLVGALLWGNGCAAPVVSGAPHLQVMHHGKPVCIVYFESQQEPKEPDTVNAFVGKGECAAWIVDDFPPIGAPSP